jgi:antirestriction protein ArdC
MRASSPAFFFALPPGTAAEELVTELGSAFLCADLGVTVEPPDDHSSYLASWLDVLKSDKRAIFTTVAHAQRAADYLHGLQLWRSRNRSADRRPEYKYSQV